MTDLLKPARWQEAWQNALGLLSRAREPLPYEPRVRLVHQVGNDASADLPTRGAMYADRYVRGPFAASHSFFSVSPGRYGIALHAIAWQGTATMQLSSFGGAPVANQVEEDPSVTTSGWSGRQGFDGVYPGPEFNLAGQEAPYRVVTGSCGQRGMPLGREVPITEWGFQYFERPLVSYFRQNPFFFISSGANVTCNFCFLISLPLRGTPYPEGF